MEFSCIGVPTITLVRGESGVETKGQEEELQKHDLGRLSWVALGEGQRGQSGVSSSLAGCYAVLKGGKRKGVATGSVWIP